MNDVGESSVGGSGKSLGKDLNPKAQEYTPIRKEQTVEGEVLVEPVIIEEQLQAERSKEEQSHVSSSSFSTRGKEPTPAKKTPNSTKDWLKKAFNISSLNQACVEVPASSATSGGEKKK
ncbi:hypothetical protein K7X08_028633 [Anisodus acutangulus]|uniref:Uncharacterized protein n=1 Tax=Anisodus acutangulus TaxID=402998 RepID=A0A9Q1LT82_9SOLA|nr:hypothetical protein K7X08_028633 [Anisodus acutangulus]